MGAIDLQHCDGPVGVGPAADLRAETGGLRFERRRWGTGGCPGEDCCLDLHRAQDNTSSGEHRGGPIEQGRNAIMEINEMTQDACRSVLTRVSMGRLGCSLENQPYVVPICFAYETDYIYVFSTF